MTLAKYKSKRNLKASREPAAKVKKTKSKNLIFVVQEHHARQLHYDLRLEAGGVLKSWAVPKKPSTSSAVKRLAIMVEDHPYSYKDFEGTIESGYGAGTVSIWDKGTYHIEGGSGEKSVLEGIKKGVLHVFFEGKRLKGLYLLVRLNNPKKNQWLLMKKKEGKTSGSTTSEKTAILTNLDKIYWPKEKYTKGDLLRYYSKIAPTILPHLKDRPISLRRFPDGIEGESFFQKNLATHPDWVETLSIEHKEADVNYLLIQNEQSLLFAANLGCIEMHPFFSRARTLQKPDFLILDLDPKGASFLNVIKVAGAIHEVLTDIEVPSYCKTSGATGLHIAIPLGAKYTYIQAEQFAELIAQIVQQKLPKICTMERSLSKRQGKVYIDCHQNHFGQTLAAPYSVRAKPGATVSTPLQWKEVKPGLDPKKFTIKTIFARLTKFGDLYAPVLDKGIDLKVALRNLDNIVDRK